MFCFTQHTLTPHMMNVEIGTKSISYEDNYFQPLIKCLFRFIFYTYSESIESIIVYLSKEFKNSLLAQLIH